MKPRVFLMAITLVSVMACGSDDGADVGTPTETAELPAVFEKFTDNVNAYVDGDFVVIETDNLPNHPSPYYASAHALYEAYNGTNPNFALNPNQISEKSITLRIPLNPAEAAVKEATPLGAIGISINGIVFFNQYAGPDNQPLTVEIDSFDQYLGHPERLGTYHYHQEPVFLTANNGSDTLLGWLLDGFPVYGPMEDGSRVTNTDLDDYHGHSHATPDHPEGIYHYHITDADPYINGNGFYGVAGTASN